jgi:hypothetical protein
MLARFGADGDTWFLARNQAVAERDAVLAPGDVIECYEPLAGGAGATR